ncbi:MAG: hypothetical protein V2I36_15600 [Desulfopila sp.]|nr:hypothetical protein [Desulfopila sp.]
MTVRIKCNYLVTFNDQGYGRRKKCPQCGNMVIPETAYQRTALCSAIICRECSKQTYPIPICDCDKKRDNARENKATGFQGRTEQQVDS